MQGQHHQSTLYFPALPQLDSTKNIDNKETYIDRLTRRFLAFFFRILADIKITDFSPIVIDNSNVEKYRQFVYNRKDYITGQ